METTTTDQAWERKVLAEIEQMRWVLGVSRQNCSLSDDTTAKVWTAALLVTAFLFAVTAGPWHYGVLIMPLAVMRASGALFRR